MQGSGVARLSTNHKSKEVYPCGALTAYLLAVAVTLFLFWLRWQFGPFFVHRPMMVLFVPAICVSAYIGGLGPGLASTALSALLLVYILVPPTFSFRIEARNDLIQLLIFVLGGLLISWLCELLHRARRKAEALPLLQQQLANVAQNMPGALFTLRLTPEGGLASEYPNPALAGLLGLDAEDLQRDAGELLARLPDAERGPFRESLQAAARTLTPWHREFPYRHPTRGEIWIECWATPQRQKGGRLLVHGLMADITERKMNAQAAATSETRLQGMLAALTEGVVIQDAGGRIIWNNPSAEKYLGLSKDQLVGRTSLDPQWRAIREDGTPLPGEEHPAMVTLRTRKSLSQVVMGIHSPDGRLTWLSVNSQLLNKPSGEIEGVMASFDDITEQKKAQENLRASEARYRSYVEKSPVAIMVADHQGRYIDGNPAAQQLLGFTLDEMLNRPLFDFVAESDHPLAAANFRDVSRLGSAACEIRMKHKDGHLLWVLVLASRMSEDRLLGYCIDVTARRKAEELVRLQGAVMQAAANAIVITDPNGRIEWVNTAFTTMTGYSAGETIGQNPRDIIKSGRQSPPFYLQLWSCIRSGKVWRGEITNRRKDGSLYTEDMTITPIRDEQGEITHFVAIKQDISERKALEAQLLRTQRLESLGRLASGIAHDLNNILAPVLMAPSVVREISQDPEVGALMDSIEKSAQRGAAIVRQLLTFGRGQEAQRSPLLLRSLVSEMIKLMRETFPRNIEIQQDIPDQVLTIEGDPTQLHQLLMNLCVNARDAMPDGGCLSIRLKEVVVPESKAAMYAWITPGPHALLTVTDTGTGIAPEHLDKIFDPFFTTKPTGEGTGLGLPTALGVVRNHRGYMEVQSQVGKGTTFEVYLPLATTTAQSEKGPSQGPLMQGQGQSILLVDDEQGIRRVLGEILRRNGYQPSFAANGEEALAALEGGQQSFHLVLTDLMMPGMDGWSLIEKVRARWPGLPIVAMSGNLPQPEWLAKIRHLVSDFLIKPCDAASLLASLQAVLAKPAPDETPPEKPSR